VHNRNFATLLSMSDNDQTLSPIGVVASGARPVPEALLRVARTMTES
jgi:hypothetical protein